MRKKKNNFNLYVFEGPDGVGKTRIANELVKKLLKENEKVNFFSFPGKETKGIGNLIYNIHHSKKYNLQPTSLQLLHIISHIELIYNWIIPALEKKEIVILDRFWLSTYVYGKIMGINTTLLTKIIEVEKQYWKGILPKQIFLIKRERPIPLSIYDENWIKISNEYENVIKELKLRGKIKIIENELGLNYVVDKLSKVILDNK